MFFTAYFGVVSAVQDKAVTDDTRGCTGFHWLDKVHAQAWRSAEVRADPQSLQRRLS
jgi:hypothetical protein